MVSFSSFNSADTEKLIIRIKALTAESSAHWGSMSASQMLAHCNKTYAMTYDPPAHKMNVVMRFLMKLFVKGMVVGPKPYKQHVRTAPFLIVSDQPEFDREQQQLIDYIQQTCHHGPQFLKDEWRMPFGALTSAEWDTMFSKHLDHHLKQFGV